MVVPTAGAPARPGPSPDYLHVATSFGEMGAAIYPNFRQYPDAHATLDLKDDEATHPLELRLRRGVTVAVRVVAPDGKPVAEAFAFGRSYVPYRVVHRGWSFNGDPAHIEAKDGRFEIPGCDPEKPIPFYFLDPKHRLGAAREISGKSAATGPLTVRLSPTASARLILKRPDGKVPEDNEVRSVLAGLRLIITPGPDQEEMAKDNNLIPRLIPNDFAYQMNLEDSPVAHPGPDGLVTLRNVIPGAQVQVPRPRFQPRARPDDRPRRRRNRQAAELNSRYHLKLLGH